MCEQGRRDALRDRAGCSRRETIPSLALVVPFRIVRAATLGEPRSRRSSSARAAANPSGSDGPLTAIRTASRIKVPGIGAREALEARLGDQVAVAGQNHLRPGRGLGRRRGRGYPGRRGRDRRAAPATPGRRRGRARSRRRRRRGPPPRRGRRPPSSGDPRLGRRSPLEEQSDPASPQGHAECVSLVIAPVLERLRRGRRGELMARPRDGRRGRRRSGPPDRPSSGPWRAAAHSRQGRGQAPDPRAAGRAQPRPLRVVGRDEQGGIAVAEQFGRVRRARRQDRPCRPPDRGRPSSAARNCGNGASGALAGGTTRTSAA